MRRALGVLDLVVFAGIAAYGFWSLDSSLKTYLLASWQPSFAEVLPSTIPAAFGVWTFWGIATVVLGAMLLRHSPELGMSDAVLGGALSVWVLAYVGLHVFGPFGVLYPLVLWMLLAFGAISVMRRPPALSFRPSWTPGLGLMLLTVAMMVPPVLLVQLGCPVPPHFDVFAPAASAQRIATFATYLPYDNDAYGYYNVATPGTELLYAILAIGGHVKFAIVAETAAMVPLTLLLIVATYRFGKTLDSEGTTLGGLAALLLSGTTLFRMLITGHGRYVAFIPAVAGLAFLLDQRRHPTRLVLGALLLGTAVATHLLIGAFAMATAAGAVACWIVSGDIAGGLAGIGLLAGASLIAMPAILIALVFVVPDMVLPLLQGLGFALILFTAHHMPRRPVRDVRLLLGPLTMGVVAVLAAHPTSLNMFYVHWAAWRYPLLWMGGTIGLLLVSLAPRRGVNAAPIVAGVGLGIVVEEVSRTFAGHPDAHLELALRDLVYKIDFWYPFALIFPAAYLASTLARWVSTRLVVYALLVLLWIPWQYGNDRDGGRDPNYNQHSIAEGWAQDLNYAKAGYWGSMGSRRWAQSPAEFELIDLLREEVKAGRITLATHIVHLTPFVYLYKDVLLFSVYTGINDDLYVSEYTYDPSTSGGRFYPAEKIHAALAQRPPYVAIHDRTVNATVLRETFPDDLALDGYDLIFDRDGIRLFRALQG